MSSNRYSAEPMVDHERRPTADGLWCVVDEGAGEVHRGSLTQTRAIAIALRMNAYLYTTAGEYRDSHELCTNDLSGADGEFLPDDYPVTINEADDEYCAGHYDGNQTWMPLS